jgi:hypothetical protein
MSPAVSAAVIALADVKGYWATFQDTRKTCQWPPWYPTLPGPTAATPPVPGTM